MSFYDRSRQEMEDGIPSSQSEWDRADALQRGEERPDQAWICTDRDVWHANPFYQGLPVPHPEDYDPWEGTDAETLAFYATLEAPEVDSPPELEDDLPF